MSRWIACLPLMIAACAPAASTEPAEAPRVEMRRAESTIAGAKVAHESMMAPQSLAMPRAQAWTGVRAAFETMGLKANGVDEAAGILSTGNFTANGRLKGGRLSRYLACGSNHGLENADSYEVEMIVSTQVAAAGDASTTLATTVQGWAKPRGTGGSNRITCNSTGQLEARLAELVRTAPAA